MADINEKTTHHTKYSRSRSKTRNPYKTAKDLLSWRQYDPGPKFIAYLCDQLLEWVNEPKSEDLVDFITDWNIPYQTFYEYVAKYPELKDTHTQVMATLGSRRQKMAIHKEYNCDPKPIMYTLYQYHPVWKQAFEDQKALQSENQSATTILKVVEVEKIPAQSDTKKEDDVA